MLAAVGQCRRGRSTASPATCFGRGTPWTDPAVTDDRACSRRSSLGEAGSVSADSFSLPTPVEWPRSGVGFAWPPTALQGAAAG
jgi:hypothetical protein